LEHVVPGWVNADVTPHIFVARVRGAARLLRGVGLMTSERYAQHQAGTFRQVRYVDVTKRFPFRNEEFENVFSSHMLEHLHPLDAEHCLRETHRVLAPGGVARISVPDLEIALGRFDPLLPEPFLEVMYTPKQSRAKNQHKWMYTGPSLERLMLRCGFSQALRCAYRKGRCQDLELLDSRPEVSLFVEAIK
jgi:SAM-dependent methyltransferase